MRLLHWLAGIVLFSFIVSLLFYLAQPEIEGLVCHFRKGSTARYDGVEIRVPVTDEFMVDDTGIYLQLGGGRLSSWARGNGVGNMLIHRNKSRSGWTLEGIKAMSQRLGSKDVAEVSVDAAGLHYECVESENHTIVDIWCIVPGNEVPFVHYFGMRRSVPEFYEILRSAAPSSIP